MERGAWQARVRGVAESDMNEQLLLTLTMDVMTHPLKKYSHSIYHMLVTFQGTKLQPRSRRPHPRPCQH